MTDILFCCAPGGGESRQVQVLIAPWCNNHPAPHDADEGALHKLLHSPVGCGVLAFTTWNELRAAWDMQPLRNVYFNSEAASVGVLLFLYSVLLTRGVANIRSDADSGVEVCMIGAHGYCTQEAVNLMLTGCASSNVFDGVHLLDDETSIENENVANRLRGVAARPDVGFLTLFEAYDSIKVGEFLKSPRWPVWVVHAESHYSIVFAQDTDSCTSHQPEFDTWYYDPLGRQDETKRITVRPNSLQVPPDEDDIDTNGMIAKVLRTKWGSLAELDWNGAEPIF